MQGMDDLQTIDAYLRGWSSRDAEAILATLAAGATYEDPSTGGPIGGAALRAYMAGLWAAAGHTLESATDFLTGELGYRITALAQGYEVQTMLALP